MKLAERTASSQLFRLLVKGDVSKLKNLHTEDGYVFHYSVNDISSITCSAETLALLIQQKIITYAELPHSRVQPLNDTMLVRNRIKPVKEGAAPLSQAYDGSGIVIGFIDTGIDVLHPDFIDEQGNTRIKFLWDQKTPAGSSVPAPYNYGIEWTAAQINASLCTHSDLQYWGHGTQVAGIAAGNGLGNGKHEGCAPKADIVVVAVDFSNGGAYTADAVNYIFDKAALLGKPCVINSSVGDYYGSHDATDLESQLIESMLINAPGKVMVAAAGNAGHIQFHVKTQSTATDTSFSWIKNGSSTLNYWCYGDTNQIKNLEISIGANRSNFSDLGRIGFQPYTYGLNTVQHDTLKHNQQRIGIVHRAAAINSSGVYELYVKIDADTTNLFWRIETLGNGMHHAWNFDFVSTGLPNTTQYPPVSHYQMPDTLYSLVSSYQCSDEVITVGNYINLNRYYDVQDSLRILNDTPGALAFSSSSGPTRDNRVKPDVAATGHHVFSALNLGMQSSQISNSPQTVAQGSLHVIGGGTSASAPVVAGLAALYLQAHPDATNQQVKTAITQCAYTDAFTGNVPNYAWGYGKLDGKAAMVCGENLVQLSTQRSKNPAAYFPNPFREKVIFSLPQPINGHICVYSAEGKLLFEDYFNSKNYELTKADLKNNSPGILFVTITGDDMYYSFKLLQQ